MTSKTEDAATPPHLAESPPPERLVGVSMAGVKTQAPMPVDLWNAKGQLLLRKGEKLDSLERQQLLSRHQPSVRESELDTWRMATRQWAQSLRSTGHAGGAPTTKTEQSLHEAWLDAHAALSVLLHQGEQVKDFLPRVSAINDKIAGWLERRPDESLFVLVQILYDTQLGYCASNALAVAAMCQVIGPTAGLDVAQQRALCHAALTMNMGMAHTQDELARQKSAPDAAQTRTIADHPQTSARMLERLGVSDPLWLDWVRCHHMPVAEAQTTDSADRHQLALQLLQVADRFVARISPRKSRRGQSVRAAVKALYQEMQARDCPLGQLMIKHLGVYLPGSYVLLANGEIAVVTRNTGRLNAPMVMAIVGKDGIALSAPRVRDTAEPAYAIKDAVPSDQVKVRLDPSRVIDPR